MIIFYTPNVEEVILASIVKHFNPTALLREYKDNNDIISIATMHDDTHFIRIKDYKLAILNKYDFPAWIKNDSRVKFVELVLAHSKTTTNEVITYLAKYLFNPEQLFHGSIDKLVEFKNRAAQVINELKVFKRAAKHYNKKGVNYYEINPHHKITHLMLKELIEENPEPVIVLNKDEAAAGNAELLGFNNNIENMNRYDAFKVKKTVSIKPAVKKIIIPTIAKRICEF
ncbi:MAG: hypothetical protein JW791_05105 [Nanoarchaeota archaeon]|nr:hypothetical protein [Nanoarchaeota archaeon]